MECPHCKTELLMAERQGVEIDHCPKCRGVWLDRGELDKIIERSNAYLAASGHAGIDRDDRDDDDDDDDFDRRRRPAAGGGGDYPRPKRKSFWTELFD